MSFEVDVKGCMVYFKNMNYRFTTIINKEGKWYNAKCAELGVVSQGKTIEEAQKNLIEATELYLENEPSVKKHIPKTSSIITTFELANT